MNDLQTAVEALEKDQSMMNLAYDAVSKGLYDEALLHLGIGIAKNEKALDVLHQGDEKIPDDQLVGEFVARWKALPDFAEYVKPFVQAMLKSSKVY